MTLPSSLGALKAEYPTGELIILLLRRMMIPLSVRPGCPRAKPPIAFVQISRHTVSFESAAPLRRISERTAVVVGFAKVSTENATTAVRFSCASQFDSPLRDVLCDLRRLT